MEFHRSPNYTERPLKQLFIVLHDAVAPTLSALRNTMLSQASRVSYHYAVGKDGTVEGYVNPSWQAWHAGRSMYQLREIVYREFNTIALGVALVGMNRPDEVYPQAQMHALIALCKNLMALYEIPPERVLRHADISLYRGKTDPRNFDLHHFRELLRSPYRLPAYHPDTNAYLGEVTVVEGRKVYPVWLREGDHAPTVRNAAY